MPNETKEGSSIGCGTILFCFICQMAGAMYYAEKYNNWKVFLWGLPVGIVAWSVFAYLVMSYGDKKKKK